MDDEVIPNPMPAWMDDRFGPLSSRPTAQDTRTKPGRRASRGQPPPERHFPGFEPPPDDDDQPQFEEPHFPGESSVPAPPQPVLSVDEIVSRAVEAARTATREGRLTLADLQAERQRVNGLRPGIDAALRELREMKPPFWRERRFWMMKVREMTHNRMHILNRQIMALSRDAQTTAPDPGPAPDASNPVSS
jgi:hypothetical protein